MSDSDKKYRIGLIGHPISHSQSPRLFRETFADRPDVLARYRYDLIEEADFDTAYSRFLSDYIAVNVTAPFKTRAFASADVHSEEALLSGATNLLVKDLNVIKAYNTDCLAVKEILQRAGFAPGDIAHVYGCGGAGRAAAVAALLLGMHVRLYNRTRSVAEAFVHTLLSLRGEWTKNIEICPLSICASGEWTKTSQSCPPSEDKTKIDANTDISTSDCCLITSGEWTNTEGKCPLSSRHSREWSEKENKCPLSQGDIEKAAVIYTLPVAPAELFQGGDLELWQTGLKDTLVIEANYRDPHLHTCATHYISGLEWLRLQALATYETVIK